MHLPKLSSVRVVGTLVGLVLALAATVAQANDIIVCKKSDTTSPVPAGTSFDFTLDGKTNFSLTVGGVCKQFVNVGVGQHVITEAAKPGTVVSAITVSPSNRLVSFDLALRTVTATAVDDPIHTTVTFVNATQIAGPLTTVTQGGWGAPPHGNNPGAILAAHFDALFGAGGVAIGCLAPGGSLTFTSAQAIQDFLPQGGTPGTLTAGNVANPTTSAAGVFAGQVLALQLNVSFSGPVFPAGLGSLVLTSGPATGLTVGQVLGLANRALGGCLTPADIAVLTSHGITTISQLNDVVDSINEKFD